MKVFIHDKKLGDALTEISNWLTPYAALMEPLIPALVLGQHQDEEETEGASSILLLLETKIETKAAVGLP